MDILHPTAVIGTNSWGSAAYETLLRGSSVDEATLRAAMRTAEECGLQLYDLAQDYGFGKAQKMIGSFGTQGIYLSAKYTPLSAYRPGCVRKSLEKDLRDFRRDFVDIYWLHLPAEIEPHLKEIITLAQEGKIHHIGVSNFNLEECQQAQRILADAGLSLYGVQNHYSLLARDWERSGLLAWCKQNNVSFWGWAVLEEGLLVDPRVKTKGTIMKWIFNGQKRKMQGLYKAMIEISTAHNITVPQVAIAFCANKGVVPICGCRKPKQVQELAQAACVKLTTEELTRLEAAADRTGARVLGADMFRAFVRKK